MVHQSGDVWLANTVPTNFGWGVFWLHSEANAMQTAKLYYAHLDFAGNVTVGPMFLLDVPRIDSRDRYYLAAWHDDHFELLIANMSALYSYTMGLDGTLSGQSIVGPTLFVSDIYSQESDGELVSYPGGFIAVIEGECQGHSCSYAFKLDPTGKQNSQNYNLVDFDFTHQFDPRVAFDGLGFVFLSVKDVVISGGGVTTKYMTVNGSPGTHLKVVPLKEYLWDEKPDIAWNGDHLGSVWTENSARLDAAPWQMHFASFRRTTSSSTLMADKILEVLPSNIRPLHWTIQILPVGPDWITQYTRWQNGGDFLAVYDWVNDHGDTMASMTPFVANASALGSSVHFDSAAAGSIGITRGYYDNNGLPNIAFQLMNRPACTP